MQKEYDELQADLSDKISNDSKVLQEIKKSKSMRLDEDQNSLQKVALMKKDMDLQVEKSKNAELKADSLMKQISNL